MNENAQPADAAVATPAAPTSSPQDNTGIPAPAPAPMPTPAPSAAPFRAGLVAIVGRTNAGKSTLLNRLVGQKVSIVTPKPQTTRHAVHGIVHRPGVQIVFVDTPGFFRTRRSALVDSLHQRAMEALQDVDVVVYLADPTREPGPEDAMVADALANWRGPRILCLGKADLPRPHRAAWRPGSDSYRHVLDVSGATGIGTDDLLHAIGTLLPESEPLYPPEDVTNATRDFRIAEVIREQVYIQAGDEVPYRTVVSIDRVEVMPATAKSPERLGVDATVFASAEKYQRMLIGRGGARVKQLREFSRRELQRVLGRKVALSLDIKVDPKIED